jgi:hypothetical protein
MLSPRRVRVFTGGDEDYVYPGSIFAKQRKSVEQRQWTGYGTPARAAHGLSFTFSFGSVVA